MPIMNPKPRLDDLPENVRDAFSDTALLSLPTVARLLGMHPSTLRLWAERGKIGWRNKGFGTNRPRRAFAIDDVASLWHTMHNAPVVGVTGAHHGETLRQERTAQKR